MAQIFHPVANTVARVSIFGAVFFAGGALWLLGAVERSPYMTQQGVVRAQPVPFSHKHHVAGLGIDCRFCHTTVEVAASAGMPSTKVCMTCHSQVWSDAEVLAPVRESYAEDRSIEWTRVHDLPDFVYFDHSLHVAKGVGCATCHGPVDQMPLAWRDQTLHMEWCLDCHRDPGPHLRPPEAVFDMQWQPAGDPAELGRQLAREQGLASQTHCSACHR